jgi:tetratricopeptide (TPR) repeat protein
MVTGFTSIQFIIIVIAFFMVRKNPIIVGILSVVTAITLIVLSDVIIFIPVALITEGAIFITSGLLEIKDRKLDENKDSQPETPGGSSYMTKPAGLKPTWSRRKKTIINSIVVLIVLSITVTIGLVSYNQRITRVSMLAEFHFNRGLTYAGKGDFDKAAAEYCKAIQLEPSYTEAYYNRGLAYLYSVNSHISDAIDDFDRVIQLDPNYAMAYYYRGIINIYGSNQESAISDLSIYLQHYPNDVTAYNYRGLSYYSKDDLDNSIKPFSSIPTSR